MLSEVDSISCSTIGHHLFAHAVSVLVFCFKNSERGLPIISALSIFWAAARSNIVRTLLWIVSFSALLTLALIAGRQLLIHATRLPVGCDFLVGGVDGDEQVRVFKI